MHPVHSLEYGKIADTTPASAGSSLRNSPILRHLDCRNIREVPMGDFDAQAISNIVNGYARMGVTDRQLLFFMAEVALGIDQVRDLYSATRQ